MISLKILEVVIGMVFVYLLFSTLVTMLVEYISAQLQLRAKNLKKIIERALDDDDKGNSFSNLFYLHPQIKYLSKKAGKIPSYIDSNKFAKTVLDVIRTGNDFKELGKTSKLDDSTISEAIDSVTIIGDETKALLKSYAKEAGEDINAFGVKLENWFDETAERGQGWFNRNIKKWTFGISMAVAIILNVDSIRIYQTLSQDEILRAQIVKNAELHLNDSINNQGEKKSREEIDKYYNEKIKANTNQLGIGWDISPCAYYEKYPSCISIFIALIGWVISGIAISLGAPFWFDTLNKITSLRSAAKGDPKKEKTSQQQVSRKPQPVG